MDKILLSQLFETAVWTVWRRAMQGKTTAQRDIYRAISAHRFYPEHQAIVRQIMDWMPSCRRVQIVATPNRAGWSALTASPYGLKFYSDPVFESLSKLRPRKKRAKDTKY